MTVARNRLVIWIVSGMLLGSGVSTAFAAPSCVNAPRLSAERRSAPPLRLSLSETAEMPGVGTSVVWKAPFLLITDSGLGRPSTQNVRVSSAAWARFWATAEKLGVWCWQPKYTSARSVQTDGTDWTLELAHAGRVLNSSGYNAVPGNYPAFKAALLELLSVKR